MRSFRSEKKMRRFRVAKTAHLFIFLEVQFSENFEVKKMRRIRDIQFGASFWRQKKMRRFRDFHFSFFVKKMRLFR